MIKPLAAKIRETIRDLREIWRKLEGRYPFVAFSTGKDSLALAALLYEAIEPEAAPCLYAHHDLEFPSNVEYLAQLRGRGFAIEVLAPFLEYFELTERGIGFLTLKDPWCIPLLIGTAFLEWLQKQGAAGPREGVMFRGISGSEYSRRLHSGLELYRRMNMPCFNPLLGFTKEEILATLRQRYGFALNPIYRHMDRTYCICCYTSDRRRQAYSAEHFPEVCNRYYAHIDELLFGSGLVERAELRPEHKSREEKLQRHGFVHWRRVPAQDSVGAIKRRLPCGVLSYRIRRPDWIATKHLHPVDGRWSQSGNEIRFWHVDEREADTLIKRMINCLDCGFCVLQCFACRRFDRVAKKLRIEGCIQCGKCVRLTFCMGWRHRFWRRVIREAT